MKNSNITPKRSRGSIVAASAVTVVLLSLSAAGIRSQIGGNKGHDSQNGELQYGAVTPAVKGGPAMGDGNAVAGNPGAPTMGDPATIQPDAGAGGSGKMPPASSLTGGRLGSGPQIGLRTADQSNETHVHMVLRLTEAGTATVVHATQQTGPAVVSDAPYGAYIVVTSNGKSKLVTAIPDPFEVRGFAGKPGTGNPAAHQFQRSATADVSVRIPDTDLTKLGFATVGFYKIVGTEPLTGSLSPEMMANLEKSGKVRQILQLTGDQIEAQMAGK